MLHAPYIKRGFIYLEHDRNVAVTGHLAFNSSYNLYAVVIRHVKKKNLNYGANKIKLVEAYLQ